MMMNEVIGVEQTTKTLTVEVERRSEDFPNTEVIYGKGLWLCPESLIEEAEQALGYTFPAELRTLYLEVGVGRLPHYRHSAHNSPNNILIPTHIPKLIKKTCRWMTEDTVVEPGTLPFFERDIGLFLCLHPQSQNPSAVYWMWGEKLPNGGKISDSLIEFFKKLVDDPDWFNPPKQ